MASQSPIILSALKHNYLEEPIEKPVENQKILINITKAKPFSNILDIIHYLEQNHISFVLLNKSCLQVVREKKFPLDEKMLYIGTNNTEIHNLLIESEFKNEADSQYTFGDYKLIVSKYTGGTKKLEVDKREVNVPYPVVTYLQRIYGKKWETINV